MLLCIRTFFSQNSPQHLNFQHLCLSLLAISSGLPMLHNVSGCSSLGILPLATELPGTLLSYVVPSRYMYLQDYPCSTAWLLLASLLVAARLPKPIVLHQLQKLSFGFQNIWACCSSASFCHTCSLYIFVRLFMLHNLSGRSSHIVSLLGDGSSPALLNITRIDLPGEL